MSDPTPESTDAAPAAPTGDVRVDTALSRLQTLDAVPVAEHVAVYDEVNRLLQDALADLDEEQ